MQYFCTSFKVLCMFAEMPVWCLLKANRVRTDSDQTQTGAAKRCKDGHKNLHFFFFIYSFSFGKERCLAALPLGQ